MQSAMVQRFSLFIFLVISVWLSYYVIQPPEPKPESSPATEFSAERAFRHVQEIAKVPHPLGSAANDSARNYILRELIKMGLNPTVQAGIGVGSSYDRNLAAYAKNIFAKIDGQNPQKTILLMAHYDSTPTTYGAADDASGTAAILETIRAIKSQETPPQNNVWVLITDGEERGLLGAELFVDEFTELEEIDLVLNVEARGTSGPSLMFETSAPNGKLIRHFARATKYPVANSLMYTVYKFLPNDTDMSVTKRAGIKGLNFAFTKDYLNYHTMQDHPGNLSLSSLQHHGSNLIRNIRYFGYRDFDLESKSEYVYFNNVTGGLIYYPSVLSFPLAVVTSLLFIGFLIFLFRTEELSFGSYLGSLLLFIVAIILAALITFGGWVGIKMLHPQYQWLIQNEVYNHLWYLGGFTLLILALFLITYSFFQKKLTTQKLISGSFTIWILLSLASAWYLPTASFVFTVPVLTALIGWMFLGTEITEISWKTTGILALSLFAVLFMLPPYLHLVQVMLTTKMLALSSILLILILGLAWPMVWLIIQNQKGISIGVLVLAAAGCFLMAAENSGYDANHKKQNSINYIQNLDSNQAYWFSRDHTTDAWTRQFLGKNYKKGSLPDIPIPRSHSEFYQNADLIEISSPTFEVTADSTSDSFRYITLQMNAGRGIAMRMSWNDDAGISEIGIHGKPVFDPRDSQNYLYYFQDLSEDVELYLTYKRSAGPPSLKFTFLDPGLPTELIPNYKERPLNAMPPPFPIFMSDATIWHKTVDLNAVISD